MQKVTTVFPLTLKYHMQQHTHFHCLPIQVFIYSYY